MRKIFVGLVLFTFLFMGASCSNDSEADLMDSDTPPTQITYEGTIKNILSTNCLGCHSNPPRNGAPFPLTTYNQVKIRAENGSLMNAISKQTGQPAAMPPTGRLPEATIATIEQWIDEGFVEQ